MSALRTWALTVLLGASLGALGVADRAKAGGWTLHVGPPSVGSGGSNPISLPPTDPIEWEYEYVTDHDFETNVSLTPGLLLFGERSTMANGVYVSFGGGIVRDANGVGPGVYSSFGYNGGGSTVKFNAEVKQAVGYSFSSKSALAPYALRIGISYGL